VASQHVSEVLPQAMASPEALGMAAPREVETMGNLLLLPREAQGWYSLEERPEKQGTQVQHTAHLA
jgi:hypothetical protein